MPTFEGTLKEAAEKFPFTQSRTFNFGNRRKGETFFMINEKPDMMVGGKNIRSILKVLVFNTITLDLYETTIHIMDKDQIIPMTLKAYSDSLEKAYTYIKENPSKYPPQILDNYIKHGFKNNN